MGRWRSWKWVRAAFPTSMLWALFARSQRLAGGPNGAALGPDGCLYVCNNGGYAYARTAQGGMRPTVMADDYSGGRIERIDLANGRIETLYTHCAGVPLNAPNDIVFDANGGFWFTDCGHQRGRVMDLGGLYYATADGSRVHEAVFPLHTPNGVGLSPDGAIVYVSETLTGRLKAFATADAKQQKWRGDASPAIPYVAGTAFDSMAIEHDGSIAVARLGKGAIVVVSAAGDLIEEVRFPDAFTTNICFGGAELRTAYVTMSSRGELVKLPWRRPGLRLAGQAS